MVARETSLRSGLTQLGLRPTDEQVSRLALLADLLQNQAMGLGFLGPNEGPRIVSRHILESAALARHLSAEGPVVDVGSGAGLPGLVLAALGRRLTLLESQARRADFLLRAADAMAVDVQIVHARAEDAGRGPMRDSQRHAVARALAQPTVAMELCLPLVAPGGSMVMLGSPVATETSRTMSAASGERRSTVPMPPTPVDEVWTTRRTMGEGAGRSAMDENVRDGPDETRPSERADAPPAATHTLASDPGTRANHAAEQAAELLGAARPRWIEMSVPGVDEPRWVMIVDKLQATPERFPRRPGVPKRRPLGGDVASVN